MMKEGLNTKKTRVMKFTLADVAESTGKTVEAVRKDKQRGLFRPWELVSLVEYVGGHRAIRRSGE